MNDVEAVELLRSMLLIPSLSGDEQNLASFLVGVMTEAGLDAHVDGAGNAVGTFGEGSPHVVLLGHMDTVPGVVQVRTDGDRLYGRGAVDAKGPLASFVCAAARLRAGDHHRARVTVVGCVEEENPSSKGAWYVAPRMKPDACIVGEPSSWDGITLGYKGFLAAELRLEQAGAHTAHEQPTAPERILCHWSRITHDADEFNATRERLFDRLLCTLTGWQNGSDGCTESATLRFKLRLPPDMGPESAETWLRDRTPGCDLVVAGGVPAWSGPRTTPLHRALDRNIRSQGGHPRYQLKTGTADLNIVAPAWGCPALAYGPGNAALDHTPDEHILVPEFLKGVAVLEGALRAFAATAQTDTSHSHPRDLDVRDGEAAAD